MITDPRHDGRGFGTLIFDTFDRAHTCAGWHGAAISARARH